MSGLNLFEKRKRKLELKGTCKFTWVNSNLVDKGDHPIHTCRKRTCNREHRCNCGGSIKK